MLGLLLYHPFHVQGQISAAKNQMLSPAAYAASHGADSIVSRVYARYDELLRRRNCIDFDDMLRTFPFT